MNESTTTQDRTPEQIAAHFAVSVEQVQAQYVRNYETLRRMYDKACATGRKVNGYTSCQLGEMCDRYLAKVIPARRFDASCVVVGTPVTVLNKYNDEIASGTITEVERDGFTLSSGDSILFRHVQSFDQSTVILTVAL